MKEPKQFLRRVEVSGHQRYYKAWFHCFCANGTNIPLAIVENDYGKVIVEDAYLLNFILEEK